MWLRWWRGESHIRSMGRAFARSRPTRKKMEKTAPANNGSSFVAILLFSALLPGGALVWFVSVICTSQLCFPPRHPSKHLCWLSIILPVDDAAHLCVHCCLCVLNPYHCITLHNIRHPGQATRRTRERLLGPGRRRPDSPPHPHARVPVHASHPGHRRP